MFGLTNPVDFGRIKIAATERINGTYIGGSFSVIDA